MDCSLRTTGAQNKLPYDIIEQIFLLCLPKSPLDEVQPNTQIAPILLCHVCSAWRAAALSTPTLWAYLYYCLPIEYIWQNNQHITWKPDIFLRDMECLKWWRQNQGSRAPFLRFELYEPEDETNHEKFPLTADNMKFFIEYLSSAQYLDVGAFTSYLFSRLVSCPRLQYVVTNYPNSDDHIDMLGTPGLLPFHRAPMLRRLRVYRIHRPNYEIAFANWFRLTHLIVHDTWIIPRTWHVLIRAVPNLQWGYFALFLVEVIAVVELPEFTLPFLSTLYLCLTNPNGDIYQDIPLFDTLHFPALQDFSIYIHANPAYHPVIAMSINDALDSAPALTKLTLGLQFFGFGDFSESDDPTSDWTDVDKLTELVPHLTHLVLDMCCMPWQPGFDYGTCLPARVAHWEEYLTPSRWLDLANPTSAVRKISIVVKIPSKECPLVEAAFRNILRLNTEGDGKDAPNVVLEILAEDTRALAPYCEGSDGWRVWGSSPGD